MKITTNDIDRVFARVTFDHGCWTWQGGRADGYGYVRVDGKSRRVHRVVFEAEHGAIPEGVELDHRCRNRLCCNPAHLDPVTTGENIRRGATGQNNALKTHCPQGHPYTAENTRVRRRPDGQPRCRQCRLCERNRRKQKETRHGILG